ncbi:MAG: 50S ribosomal protein L4 [Oscillospiraceae bacterium]|jgi:large subunit ribosomal protein L4|nr:50S ribosomal protein L4 [Oscillospiraceae bacterium]
MPTITLTNMQGASVGEIELPDELFAADVNVAAMHLVVRSIRANQRQGTKSTLTRTEVRGGGKKIYRQKGTGNARHHGNRAPQFRHGGVVFAPKPRDFVVSVPRKVRRLALKSALTCKANEKEIIVLDQLALTEPKTRRMAEVLKNLGSPRKALIVTKESDSLLLRATRNIPGVKLSHVGTLNVYDILAYDFFIITQEAVRHAEEVFAS